MGEKKTDEYLTIDEAALYTRMGKSTLHKRKAEGLLNAYKPAKILLFSKQELDNLIRKSKV